MTHGTVTLDIALNSAAGSGIIDAIDQAMRERRTVALSDLAAMLGDPQLVALHREAAMPWPSGRMELHLSLGIVREEWMEA
jgi:hypothetical protein